MTSNQHADDSPSVMGGTASPMPTQADRRDAYKRLYVARMVSRGVDEQDASACFEAGGEPDYDADPEDAADDELSYWENDGD